MPNHQLFYKLTLNIKEGIQKGVMPLMPAIDVKINPKYMQYLNDDRKYQIFFGSAGSG